MTAPHVRLVHDAGGAFSNVDRPERVHVIRGVFDGSVRAPGPLLLAPDAWVTGDVDARGAVHLARGARVGGALRAAGEVVLGANARVEGSLRAEGNVTVQSGAVVAGELDAAGDVRLAPRARVERLVVGGDLHVRQPVRAPRVRVRGRVNVDPA